MLLYLVLFFIFQTPSLFLIAFGNNVVPLLYIFIPHTSIAWENEADLIISPKMWEQKY